MSANNPNTYLACDIDRTLIAGINEQHFEVEANRSLVRLCRGIVRRRMENPHVRTYFGKVSGRTLKDQQTLEADSVFRYAASLMDSQIGSVGAEMDTRDRNGSWHPVPGWPSVGNWDVAAIEQELIETIPRHELRKQPDNAQSEYKLSFFVNAPGVSHEKYVQKIKAILANKALRTTVIYSAGEYLDILPVTPTGDPIEKGRAIHYNVHYLANRDSLPELPIVAYGGDSENDQEALLTAVALGGVALLPRNISKSMRKWALGNLPPRQRHIAHSNYAAGILEGMQKFQLLD